MLIDGLKKKYMEGFWSTAFTGYWAKANEYKKRGFVSEVHANFKDAKTGQLVPACGYKPAKTMSYQWCSSGLILKHITCPKCLELIRKG